MATESDPRDILPKVLEGFTAGDSARIYENAMRHVGAALGDNDLTHLPYSPDVTYRVMGAAIAFATGALRGGQPHQILRIARNALEAARDRSQLASGMEDLSALDNALDELGWASPEPSGKGLS